MIVMYGMKAPITAANNPIKQISVECMLTRAVVCFMKPERNEANYRWSTKFCATLSEISLVLDN